MAIHLVQRAHGLTPCLRAAADGDVVVLMGEGVNALLLDHPSYGALDCYACDTDVTQRGLHQQLPTNITLLSDDQLVVLCTEHTPVVTWTKP